MVLGMTLTLEQLAARRRGIGASEIAAVVGINPWASPISVYASKIGVLAPASSAAIDRGNFLEPAVREWYSYQLGRRVSQPGTLVHPDNPLVLATPDGISHGADGDILLEIKAPGSNAWREWGPTGTDEIPDYYVPQVIWGMAVTGLKRAHVAAHIWDEMRIYTIEYDPELFAALEERAMAFWHDHVVPQKPPPADGSKCFSEWLKGRFSSASKGSVKPKSSATNRLATLLMGAKTKAAKANERVLLIKNRIQEAMGEHEALDTDFGRITWSNNKDSVKIDWAAVAQDLASGEIDKSILEKHTTVRPGARQFRDFLKKDTCGTETPAASEDTK